jgi:hypothetical protein
MQHVRDSVMIKIAIPGKQREVEFFEDGDSKIERFVSVRAIEDEGALVRIWSETEEPTPEC